MGGAALNHLTSFARRAALPPLSGAIEAGDVEPPPEGRSLLSLQPMAR